MTVIKGDIVIAGSVNKVNTEPLETYLANTIVAMTEEAWEALTEAEKSAYKFALVYQGT